MSEKWKPNRMWTRNGSTFAVEISVHTVAAHDDDDAGPWRWAVYAYVRKSHPYFAEFDGDDIFQNATAAMPFHWGCTYVIRTFESDGEISCVKAGADYNHLHDEWFTRQEEMPGEVQNDADELYEWMLGRESDGEEEGES